MGQGVIFEVSHATDPWSPVWVDHTSDLIEWEVDRGRRLRSGRMEAGKGRFILDNAGDRGRAASRWDPSNPSGPRFGQLEEWRPVRLRYDHGDGSTPRPIFYGYLNTLVPRGNVAELRAVDGFKHFAEVPTPSGWEATMLDFISNPSATTGTVYEWWRLGQAGIATREYPTGATAIAEGGTIGRPVAPAVAGDPDGATTINNGYIVLPPSFVPSTHSFNVTISFRISQDSATQVILSMFSTLSGVLTPGLQIGIWGTGAGHPQGSAYVYLRGPAGDFLAYDIQSAMRFDDGENHTISIRFNPSGTGLQIAADGFSSSNFSSAPGSTVPASYLYIYDGTVLGDQAGGGFPSTPVTVDEFAVVVGSSSAPGAIGMANSAYGQTYWRGLKTRPRERVAGLLDLAAWPAALRDTGDVDADADWAVAGVSGAVLSALTGPLDEALLGNIQALAEGLLGEVYIDRAGVFRAIGVGTLAARTTIAATFGGAGLPFKAGDPVRTRTYGGVRISPTPSRPVAFPVPSFTGPLQVTDATAVGQYLPRILKMTSDVASIANAQAIAAELLDLVKAPLTYWPKLTVPTSGLTSAERLTLLEADLLDRITVNASPPAGGYSLAVDSRIAGISHRGKPGSDGRGSWTTDVYTTPNV